MEDSADLVELELEDGADGADLAKVCLDRFGWGDGLPLVAPTEEKLAEALSHISADPEEVIAVLPPRHGVATVRAIAVNAVLAGCAPELLPVLIAAVRAMARREVNLTGVNATTHPTAPLAVVHGEAAQELGFNSGKGAFGPGNRANAGLGRAIRFVLLHIAGASKNDASTQGQPSKYTYCIAENEEDSPWENYAKFLGISAPSALTLFFGENPHNFHDMESSRPEGILDKAASVMATLGCNNACISGGEFFICLSPEHAHTIANAGWGREEVQEYLFQRARRPAKELREHFELRVWEQWMEEAKDSELLPMTASKENIAIIVAGGAGKHSSVIPSWGMTKSQTLPVL